MSFVIRRGAGPIKYSPKITLENRPPYRVGYLLLGACVQKFIEETNGFDVRRSVEEVFGLQP